MARTIKSQRIEMSGTKYHRLNVGSFVGKNKHGHPLWECVCDCGNMIIVATGDLRSGNTKSCGCLNKEILNKRARQASVKATGSERPASSYRAYKSYMSAVHRCNNKNANRYEDYGGRGITVNILFKDLLNEIGERPKGRFSLDRINVNGNYESGNIRWANDTTQARNTRRQKTSGVIWRNDTKKWRAYIGVSGGIVHLGSYKNKKDAQKARGAALIKYNYVNK